MVSATQKNDASAARWPPSRRTTIVAGLVFALLAASYVVNAADRQVFPVLLKAINHDYGFTLAEGGLLATIFTLGIGLGGLPTGRLLDRVSRKTTLLIGIAIYSAFTIATPLSFGFGDMAAYRVGSGIGEAMQNAALFSAVGAYFYTRRSLALGILNVAYGLGGFLGPLIGAHLFAKSESWHLPFYVFGIVGFVFVVAILALADKHFTEAQDSARDKSIATTVSNELPSTLLNRSSILICLTCVAAGLSLYSYLGLYPTFLQTQLNFTVEQAGFASAMFGIGSLAASIPAGYLGDRFGNRIVLQVSFACAMLAGALMFMVATRPAEQAALSFCEGAFGSGFVYVNLYSAVQRSLRSSLVGRASGAFVTYFYLPSAVSGYIFGDLVERAGWGTATAIQLILVPFLGAMFMTFAKLPKPEAEVRRVAQREAERNA